MFDCWVITGVLEESEIDHELSPPHTAMHHWTGDPTALTQCWPGAVLTGEIPPPCG